MFSGISIEMNNAAEVGATVLDDEESAAEVMVLAMEFAGFAPGDGADPATVKAAMAALLDAVLTRAPTRTMRLPMRSVTDSPSSVSASKTRRKALVS